MDIPRYQPTLCEELPEAIKKIDHDGLDAVCYRLWCDRFFKVDYVRGDFGTVAVHINHAFPR